jgi:hypothetical protein
MKKYSFSSELLKRKIDPNIIKDGDIVAFEWYKDDNNSPQKGVACMGEDNLYHAAYNLFRDDEGVWFEGKMPTDVVYFSPTKEEYELALEKFGNKCFKHINFLDPVINPSTTPVKDIIEQLEACYKEQQEVALRTISFLTVTIKKKNELISNLIKEKDMYKDLPSEDDFVKRLVKETKHLYKHEKDKIDVIRKILYHLHREDEETELDAWIEERQKPLVNIENAADVIAEGGRKIINNHE